MKLLLLILGLGIFILQTSVDCFNIDTDNPIVFSHDVNDSYFGFSVTLHRQGNENILYVGAPRAQSTFLTASEGERSGALFKCPIDTSDTGASAQACSEVELDSVGHEYSGSAQILNATDQWLGATVASGGIDGTLVVCRPHFKRIFNQGYSSEKWQLIGGCFVSTDGFTDDISVFTPGSNSGVSSSARSRCELGVSAAAREDQIIYGAPGSYLWAGYIWDTTTTINSASDYSFHYANRQYNSYYGHAVVFGNFKGDEVTEYAASAPRYQDGFGRVSLFDDTFKEYSNFDGTDLGAYFGHALAVSDLNNDGWDDLVITTPLYTDVTKNIVNGWEVGAIQIYYNDNQGGFLDYERIIGSNPGCRFGYTVAALGDINQDGFNDLAVGAPFCAEGDDGKVYIYHGTGKNLPLNPSSKQTLYSSSFETPLKFFGFSISAGLDIDGNTYPDLAIGAYKSNNAVVLRSKAVVATCARISGSGSLDLDIKNSVTLKGTDVTGFNVTVCILYDGQGLPDKLDFSYEVVLDSARQEINRRAVLAMDDSETTSASFDLKAVRGQDSCIVHDAFILPSISDKQTPITLSLTYELLEDAGSSSYLPPILDETSTTHVTTSISFKLECANVTCLPDLSINATSAVSELVVGTSQDIRIDITVVNSGEDAFLSILDIAEASGLYYVQVDRLSSGAYASCSYSATTLVRSCDIGNPISASDTLTIGLHYQTAEYSSFSGDIQLNLTVRSADDEKLEDTSDNDVTVFIPVYAKANLTLIGTANPEKLILYETDYPEDRNLTTYEDIGPQITHDISLTNLGPSFIGATEIEILFPMRLESGEVFINITSITTDAGDTCNITTRERDTGVTSYNSISNSIEADCDFLPECYVIICPVDSLGSGDNAARSVALVSVTARVVADAAIANSSHYINIVSTISADVEGNVYTGIKYSPQPSVGSTKVYTKLSLSYEETVLQRTKETPLWIYLVSALGGVALLIGIIVILYVLGFFKRKQITTDQKRLLRESRRSRSRAATTETILSDDGDAGVPKADGLENAAAEKVEL